MIIIMTITGIICEYNPFHLGHYHHIIKTRQVLNGDTAVVCVMSGNYVQRGDFAIFNKHARAKMAVQGGADLVIELPVPYILTSAERFAHSGVYILDQLGICDYLSFGSECGNIDLLTDAANIIVSDEADILTKQWLDHGVSYAVAQQKAADSLIGIKSKVFKSPNNVLGIEYIKALKKLNSPIMPVTFKRTGGMHDADSGFSASALRKKLVKNIVPQSLMPGTSIVVCLDELEAQRGPVFMKNMEPMILSRLRGINDFSDISGSGEGLERRLKKYASFEPSIEAILNEVKTKRYPMSRLRRILMCAVLGIKKEDVALPPPYIRVLAMNNTGMKILAQAGNRIKMPIITKPASIHKQCESIKKIFNIEACATDFYVLGYRNEREQYGGQEWRRSPVIINTEKDHAVCTS